MRGWIIKGPDKFPKLEITNEVVINERGKYDMDRRFCGWCKICHNSFSNLSDFIAHFLIHDEEKRRRVMGRI